MADERTDLILDIKNLKVIYKTDMEVVEAVNNIDLRIGRGKTLGLVGETGAGKTTTALSILRLLPAVTGKVLEGEIHFDGQNLMEFDEHFMHAIRGNRISMVFQDPMTSLNPVLTVGDQIAEAISLHNDQLSKEEIDRKVEDTLSMVGILPKRKSDYPHQFSGGMKQRVIIAMALCCEPELLIADEPTTALDVTIQAQVLAMMRELRERLGMAMLMITHDLGIVAQTCDDVAVMYAGEIVEAGTVEDIFTGERCLAPPPLHRGTLQLHPQFGLPRKPAEAHPRSGSRPHQSAQGLRVLPPLRALHGDLQAAAAGDSDPRHTQPALSPVRREKGRRRRP